MLMSSANTSVVKMNVSPGVSMHARGKYHLKSNPSGNQRNAHQTHYQPSDLGDDICCYFVWGRDKVFFFCFCFCHLTPQRLNSLNSSRRYKTVRGFVLFWVPSPIVWLKLEIKILRQSQFIQSNNKGWGITHSSLLLSRCLILNVGSVLYLFI